MSRVIKLPGIITDIKLKEKSSVTNEFGRSLEQHTGTLRNLIVAILSVMTGITVHVSIFDDIDIPVHDIFHNKYYYPKLYT